MDVLPPYPFERITLADVLAPVAPEAFRAEVRGKKPLHVPGPPDKFAFAMSWDLLNGLLDQSVIWTPHTLKLVLDKTPLPTAEYAREDVGRDGKPTHVIDFERVRALVRRGASLVLNQVETLTPGTKAIAEALSREPGGKVQANLYCSWKRRQAFDVHFDTHDVFAMQIAGEKMWRVYGRHFTNPINYPAFLPDQAFNDAHKGALSCEIVMRPGDLLYIPRGVYHEAVAESDATVHLSYSVVSMIGLDVITLLYESAVMDELFRGALPDPSLRDGNALDEYLMRIAGRLREMLREPKNRRHIEHLIRNFRHPIQRLKLPDDAYRD